MASRDLPDIYTQGLRVYILGKAWAVTDICFILRFYSTSAEGLYDTRFHSHIFHFKATQEPCIEHYIAGKREQRATSFLIITCVGHTGTNQLNKEAYACFNPELNRADAPFVLQVRNANPQS